MDRRWYALRVVSGQENKITKLITAMSEDDLFSMWVGDVHIPIEMVMRSRKGKQFVQKRRLLPGYILIELEMPQVGWRNVVSELRAIDGVIGFASSASLGDKPQSLTEEEAKDMLRFGKEGVAPSAIRVQQIFTKGESVNITNGPFGGFTGTVEDIDDDRSILKVTVEIFGRITPIDLSFEQAEKT